MKSPIALLQSLLNDFSRLTPDVKGLDRDLETIKKRFENEGYGFLTVALPSLDDALLRGLSSGRFACPTGFKSTRGGTIPRIFSGMFSEVFEPLTGNLKENVSFDVLKNLHGLLRLFKKTQMSSDDVDKLHKKAVSEFFRCDELASRVIITDRQDHLIGCVSRLILNTLSSKSIEDGEFRHGPGAVYEGLSSNQKWSELVKSVKNAEFDLDGYGYSSFGVSMSERFDMSPIESSPSSITFKNRASSCTARLITVDKNSTSRRTITVEPLLNQFRQQGLNILLRDSILECKILSKSLSLTDQSKNQHLALEGSQYDNWATIDLKSASDLLSVKLVESVFRHHGHFFDHMMDCRSTSVECDLEVATNLGKFAGMGNALTFPVQSICFAVICIAAILDQAGTKPTYWNTMRAARHVRVYGDDIIVSKRHAHQCVDWLHSVGLIVNTKKSFLEGNFKESCGVEAFRGVDITPLYIRQRPDLASAEPALIKNYVSLSNQSWFQGLYEFSNALKDIVETVLRRRLPLVSVQSGVLGWHSRLDAMTPHKWCRNTHQFLTRADALIPLKRKDKLSGYAALLKFFHVPLIGRDVKHLQETSIRYKLRIKPRWVPTRVSVLD